MRRIPIPYSRPIVSGLNNPCISPSARHKSRGKGKIVRGSSSSMFSKYLLPYRSMPTRVPALVSPVIALTLAPFQPTRLVDVQPYRCSIKRHENHVSNSIQKITATKLSPNTSLNPGFVPAFGGRHPIHSKGPVSTQLSLHDCHITPI